MIISKKFLEEKLLPYGMQGFFEAQFRGEDCELENFLEAILEKVDFKEVPLWVLLLFNECEQVEKDLIIKVVAEDCYDSNLRRLGKILPSPYKEKIKKMLRCDECGRCCDC